MSFTNGTIIKTLFIPMTLPKSTEAVVYAVRLFIKDTGINSFKAHHTWTGFPYHTLQMCGSKQETAANQKLRTSDIKELINLTEKFK